MSSEHRKSIIQKHLHKDAARAEGATANHYLRQKSSIPLKEGEQFIIRQLRRHQRRTPNDAIDENGRYHIQVDLIASLEPGAGSVSFGTYERFMYTMNRFGLLDESLPLEQRLYRKTLPEGTAIFAVVHPEDIEKLYAAHHASMNMDPPTRIYTPAPAEAVS